MEMFGAIVLIVIGVFFLLSAITQFVAALQATEEMSARTRVAIGGVMLVIALMLWWGTGQWLAENYDLVRVR